MSGSFLRKTSIHRLLRTHSPPTTTTTSARSILKQPTTTTAVAESKGSYYRFSHFFKKSTRGCDGISPSPFIFPFSSSSSSRSSTASFSKIGLVGWYLGMLKSKPILTKSITSSCIYIAADLSSQLPISEPYDLLRTSRMAGYGLLILGPTLHFWFNFMSKLFPKRDLIATFKKIIMGQTLYGPLMTAVFFSLNASLQGESSVEIVARLKRDLPQTLLNGIMYWPFCDFITFKFFPVYLQPLVSNSFSYVWTVYLTYTASLKTVDAAS